MNSYLDRRRLPKPKRVRTQSTPIYPISSSGPVSHGTVQRARTNAQQLSSSDILSLQHTVGNQTVQRLLTQDNDSSTPDIQRDGTGSKSRGEFFLDDEVIDDSIDSPGFELIEDQENPGPVEGSRHYYRPPSRDTSSKGQSRYYNPNTRGILPQKEKKTLREKFKKLGRVVKQTAKNHTVNSYGKVSIHAMMNSDEKVISRAERLAKKNPDEARKLLRGVYKVTKQDISELNSIPKTIRLALLAPIWFTRWQIAHARWKALAKQLGIIKPEDDPKDTPITETETPPQEQESWQRASPEKKDIYGWLHATMLGVGQDTHKGKGMSDRQKMLVWQKWRMREMSDPGVMMGKNRIGGWLPSYVGRGQEREGSSRVELGQQRMPHEWKSGELDVEKPQQKFLSSHRWQMEKPTGERSTDFKLGKHRPDWGLEQPSGERNTDFMLGKHRQQWDYSGTKSSMPPVHLGSHRQKWDYSSSGGGRSSLKLGYHRPEWRFSHPKGTQSGLTTGTHRVPPRPWETAYARYLHLPGSAPETSMHRRGMEHEPISEPTQPSVPQESMAPPPETSESPEPQTVPSSVQVGKVYTVTRPLLVQRYPYGGQVTIRPRLYHVYIAGIIGDRVFVESEHRIAGYATLEAVNAAIDFD